ncbi:hypothetical protein JHK87_031069 [Glycine soja]|nr:hypothetical protein JHK87_031069 [Glycine soja]
MEEGFAVNKSLMFKGANYDNWKERMIAFFESTHINMWDVVEKEEYSKVHNFKSAKQMCMKEGEDIQTMFGRFQTILNKLRSLGRHYDHNDKILRSLSRKWRLQVTTLRTIKNLNSMTLEDLVGILKVYEKKLAQDEGTKKGKSLALTVQRPNHNYVSKETSSKALAINDASEEESNDDEFDEEDNELSLITRKIWKIRTSGLTNRQKDTFTRKRKFQSSAMNVLSSMAATTC